MISDDFEEPTLNSIWREKKLAPGSWKIQSEIVRSGSQAICITVRQGDIADVGRDNNLTERAELQESKSQWLSTGQSATYRFSVFLPKDFPIFPIRLVLAQWKQSDPVKSDAKDSPVIALRYVNGELYITTHVSGEKNILFRTREEVRGRWLDFKFDITFALNGKIDAYLEGLQIVKYLGPTIYSEEFGYTAVSKFFFKMGLYRDTTSQPMTAYFDAYSKESLN